MELEEKMCFSFKYMLLILGEKVPERNNYLDLIYHRQSQTWTVSVECFDNAFSLKHYSIHFDSFHAVVARCTHTHTHYDLSSKSSIIDEDHALRLFQYAFRSALVKMNN